MKRTGPKFFQKKSSRGGSSTKPLDRTPQVFHITGLSHEGRGIAQQQGKTVFISGALPDETVSAHLIQQRSRYDEARCNEVIKPSSERVTPLCPHYTHCGGCELQHLDAEAQLIAKQQQALQQLSRLAGVTPAQIEPPLDAGHWYYRRRTRISIYCPKQRSEPVLGFRRKHSKELVAIQQCPVLEQRAQPLLAELSTWLHKAQRPQSFSHLELVYGDADGALILRHPGPIEHDDQQRLAEICRQQGLHLLLQPAGPESLHTLDGTTTEQLRLHYALPDYALELAFHPRDFIQVNRELNRKMVAQAMEWLAPAADDRVLELFAGLGNFSLPLARSGAEVVAVEGSEPLVQRGAENARRNQLSNVDFYPADLNSDFRRQPWFAGGFNKLLLDPPRAGAQEAIRHLEDYPVDALLYVSCDPATLARDTRLLIDQGYRLERWGVMNMFPHTAHIESMALFVYA